jgi:hypothetical protein
LGSVNGTLKPPAKAAEGTTDTPKVTAAATASIVSRHLMFI